MRVLIAFLLALSSPALAAVEIVDGDTLRIDGDRVRLWGMDAPERKQACQISGQSVPIGQRATDTLRQILTNGPLRCDAKDRDRYGRTVSECWAGEVNVSEAMVRLGWAWALPRYSKDRFLSAQEEAERENRGVWAGRRSCEAPARFRQQHRW
jgi:endonuclease YncB( thermonuclease family)